MSQTSPKEKSVRGEGAGGDGFSSMRGSVRKGTAEGGGVVEPQARRFAVSQKKKQVDEPKESRSLAKGNHK